MIYDDCDMIIDDYDIANSNTIIEECNKPVKKQKRFKNFSSALSIDSITGDKVFEAKVGDLIFMEYRESSWRNDAYFEVQSIDSVTGRLGLFDVERKCSALSNFKRAHEYGHFIWIPLSKKIKIKKRRKKRKSNS